MVNFVREVSHFQGLLTLKGKIDTYVRKDGQVQALTALEAFPVMKLLTLSKEIFVQSKVKNTIVGMVWIIRPTKNIVQLKAEILIKILRRPLMILNPIPKSASK